jgi:hypothetical protein
MSEIGYIVRVNGLFNIPEKVSKPLGRGLMEQIDGAHTHNSFSIQDLEAALEEMATVRAVNTAERRMTLHTGPAGMAQFEQAMQDSFRDQLMTGSSHVHVSLDSEGIPTISANGTDIANSDSVVTTSIIDDMRPYQHYYNVIQNRLDTLIGEERDRQHEGSTPPRNSLGITRTAYQVTGSEDRRRLVLNTLQRQLQQGEISVMDYLDLISQQE